MNPGPTTLQHAIRYFADYEHCHAFMVAMRWPDGIVLCPRCGSAHIKYLASARAWKCYAKHAQAKFTLKTGTVFEDSPLGLDKWLPIVWMIVNCKNGVSSWEIHRAFGVTQKTAWFMLHRVRLAMQDTKRGGGKLSGGVEVDETFIGGKARNMHARVRKAKNITPGGGGKTIVMGVLKRGGEVRTEVIPNREAVTLQPIVYDHVRKGSKVYTDEHLGYLGLDKNFAHGVINHAQEYVRGAVHTNGMENFWALVKRTIGGTYVSVEPFHLFRYLDEQSFRFNHRATKKTKWTDSDRFALAVSRIVGKRLTYKALTGKEGETPVPF